MLYTSYFAKQRELEANGIVPVAICAKPPVWYTGVRYRDLAPDYETLMDYKNNGNEIVFTQRYNERILRERNAEDVMSDIAAIVPEFGTGNVDVALLCFEKGFCHRHLVRIWLNNSGYRCEEW